MNTQRYVTGSLAVFLFLFLVEGLFHGVIMADTYAANSELLRPEADANSYFIFMILGFLVFAFGFSFIFIKGYQGRGIMEGVRFGLYTALTFSVGTSLINFAVYPYPASWLIAWIIAYPIIMMGAGAVIALVYKPKQVTI